MNHKLYHGNSQYLSLEATKKYIKKILEENSSLSLTTLDAELKDSQQIFDTLNSPSLFASERIILLKRLYKNKDKDRLIENIIQLITKENTNDILIFWEDQKIRSTTKYLKAFSTNKATEEYTQLNKRTFFTWLKGKLEEEQIKADINTQRELAERTNYDPERCANEIKKLKLENNTELTQESLENFTQNTLEKDIWKLIDAINIGNKTDSIEILEKLKLQNNDPIYILSMIARNLRLLTLTKYLVERNTPFKEIASILKIPPFTLPSLQKTSSQYDMKRLKTIYAKLSNLDYQMKTGKIDGNLGLALICPYL